MKAHLLDLKMQHCTIVDIPDDPLWSADGPRRVEVVQWSGRTFCRYEEGPQRGSSRVEYAEVRMENLDPHPNLTVRELARQILSMHNADTESLIAALNACDIEMLVKFLTAASEGRADQYVQAPEHRPWVAQNLGNAEFFSLNVHMFPSWVLNVIDAHRCNDAEKAAWSDLLGNAVEWLNMSNFKE